MAQRWVTEEELLAMQNQYANGGNIQQGNPLMEFFEQLPPELQEKIQMLPPEKQQEVLMELMQRNQQASNQSVEQFPLGGLIGRRRRDDNGFDDFMKNAFYDPSGKLFLNQQSYDRYIQFMYPNQQQQAQQPYSFQIPQINIDINKFKPIFKRNHFAEGGSTEDQIPVEAERNETLTTQDGTQPDVDGGYLEQKSYNPISGQATYEIPDNEHNQTHPEGGVNMMLKEGDVVNSDKTKIPTDFKVYGKNFKGKTFKDASDFLSKKEEDTQKQLEELEKEGKADKVTENSVSLMLTKLAVDRNNLNDLQEQVLESKKQKEFNEELISNKKQFGGLIKKLTKSQEEYDKKFDRFLNGYTTERPVVKAESGYKASVEKLKAFTDKIASNPKMSTQDVMSAFKQSGLYRQPSDNTSYNSPMFNPINGSKTIQNFKDTIASKETRGYKNPYIAVAGVSEKDASKFSFNELAPKRASTAVGKYQFVWSIHKDDIKRVTGIADPDKFRYSPEAQEAFMDWFRDNRLLPQATKIKQKYQVPLSINQLMAMVHLEGAAGLEKKIKTGALKTSTYAGNFKNASPLDYAQGFEHGGYASKGIKIPKLGFQAINQFENTKGTAQGTSMQMGDNYAQSQEDVISDFILTSIGEDTWNKMPDNLKTQVYSYIFNRGAKPDVWKGLATAIDPNAVYKGHADIDEARRALDFNKSLQIIKNADFSKPEIYNNYIDQVLPQQYQSIADNYDPGFDDKSAIPRNVEQYYYHNPKDNRWYVDSSKSLADPKLNLPTTLENFQIGQQIYKNTWQNRAKDINQIYSGLNPVANTLIASSSNSSGTTPIVSRPNPFSIWKGDKSGINKADYTAQDLQDIAANYFPNKKYTSNSELQQDILDYLGDDYGKYVIPTPQGTITGKNLTRSLVDNKFGDDWNLAIQKLKEGIIQPINPVGVQKLQIPSSSNYNIENITDIDKNNLNKNRRGISSENDDENTNSKQNVQPNSKKSSILDKLGYGLRESLPYLDNLRLLMEGMIMPTLQQKPYQNPYDNLITDVNIQSSLNDIDRSTLTGIADSTGNPSVRNARVAQLIANAQASKSPLYTQKYNQEKQLENQKTLGQMSYLNQWEDTNRDLRKRYEQEVLQTIENQRQQQHMAINKMMNDYLRKQESNQSRDLALLETNYDWNPYMGKYEFNPEKAKQNFAYKKATFSGNDINSKIIEGDDGKKYEIIAPKSGKPIVREIKKYGGKIKRK